VHTPTLYVNMLGTANNYIKQKTEGLTHADSMLQLPIPANCMHWILGHIMVHREQILGVIDGVTKPDEDEFALYGVGSEPLTDPDKAIPLETILTRLDDLSDQVVAALEKMPASRLDDLLDEEQGVTVAQRLHFNLVYHEAYHVGQLALLERAQTRLETVNLRGH